MNCKCDRCQDADKREAQLENEREYNQSLDRAGEDDGFLGGYVEVD